MIEGSRILNGPYDQRQKLFEDGQEELFVQGLLSSYSEIMTSSEALASDELLVDDATDEDDDSGEDGDD